MEPHYHLRLQDMANTARDSLRPILLLFGSFVFGSNAAIVLHELGHAAAIWVTGGVVVRIRFEPFAWSYAWGLPANYFFMVWAGFGLGTAFALLLMVLVWRFRNPYWTPVFMIGPFAMFVNGVYMIGGMLLRGRGDVAELIRLGTLPFLIAVTAIALVSGGIILEGVAMPRLGLRWNDPLGKRIAIFGGGLLPYLGWAVIYHVVFNSPEFVLWLICGNVGTILFVGVPLSAVLQSRCCWVRTIEAATIGWKPACFAVILGIAFFAVASSWL